MQAIQDWTKGRCPAVCATGYVCNHKSKKKFAPYCGKHKGHFYEPESVEYAEEEYINENENTNIPLPKEDQLDHKHVDDDIVMAELKSDMKHVKETLVELQHQLDDHSQRMSGIDMKLRFHDNVIRKSVKSTPIKPYERINSYKRMKSARQERLSLMRFRYQQS